MSEIIIILMIMLSETHISQPKTRKMSGCSERQTEVGIPEGNRFDSILRKPACLGKKTAGTLCHPKEKIMNFWKQMN